MQLNNPYRKTDTYAMHIGLVVLCTILIIGAIFWLGTQNDNPAIQVGVRSPINTNTAEQKTTVAFIGDQGYGESAESVLRLIKNEGTDVVIHSGDFDYTDNPNAWDAQITEVLGADFPYLASIGNHDVAQWTGYQQKLNERLARTPTITCEGDMGINTTCLFNNVTVILSGIGTQGENHLQYLEGALSQAMTPWNICSWHKNQRLMQVGGKSDEVGWEAYDACRAYGAIIATGHEHSYERTHLMANFATQTVADTSSTLYLRSGYSFAFVSGIAGHSIRDIDDQLDQNPWWASVYTSAQDATYGALFCSFPKSPPLNAPCYFKNIDGVIVDSFSLTTDSRPQT